MDSYDNESSRIFQYDFLEIYKICILLRGSKLQFLLKI